MKYRDDIYSCADCAASSRPSGGKAREVLARLWVERFRVKGGAGVPFLSSVIEVGRRGIRWSTPKGIAVLTSWSDVGELLCLKKPKDYRSIVLQRRKTVYEASRDALSRARREKGADVKTDAAMIKRLEPTVTATGNYARLDDWDSGEPG